MAPEPTPSVEELEQRIADLTRQRAALRQILAATGASASLSTVLKESLRGVLLAARGDAGFIHLRHKKSDAMQLVASEGISDTVRARVERVSSQDGLVAWVARNSRPLLIPDTGQDPRTVYLTDSDGLAVYAGVPVVRGARVWGTLSVLGRDESQFGEEEVALLLSIGEEIGTVLEHARLHRETERLLVVEERNRLARELHDSVTQSLYSLTLFAEAGRRAAEAGQNEDAAGTFSQIGEAGLQALKEMRLLVYRLRPPILAEEGLERALQHRLHAVEGRAGVTSELAVEGAAPLSPGLQDALYQIAQEALNNALKHAAATEVRVSITTQADSRQPLGKGDAREVTLAVADNGRGFEPAPAGDSGGLGLTSMSEWAQMYNGAIDIDSRPGQGTTVTARLKESAPGPDAAFDEEDFL